MAANHLQDGKAENKTDHSVGAGVSLSVDEDTSTINKSESEYTPKSKIKYVSIGGSDQPYRKKSCFVITRVIEKDSIGDQDSVDDLDETNTEEVSSDILDISKQTDIDPDPSSEDTVQSAVEDLAPQASVSDQVATSEALPELVIVQRRGQNIEQMDNIQSLSRFKVVKIESAQPFRRGRWSCQDFLSPPSAEHLPDKTFEDVAGSANSSAANSVHYVPGVDDPAKNPVGDGFQNVTQDAQQSNRTKTRSMHSPPSNNGPGLPSANSAFIDPTQSKDLTSNAVFMGNGNQQYDASSHGQSLSQPAVGQAHTQPHGQTQPQPAQSFTQNLGNVQQSHLQGNPVGPSPANTEYNTEYMPNNTEYIPKQPNTQPPGIAPINTLPKTTTAQPDFQKAQNTLSPNQPQTDQPQSDHSTDFQSNSMPSQNVADMTAPGDGKQVGGGGGGGTAMEGADTATQREQHQEGNRSREATLSSMKGMGSQGLLTPPLLQMAMQPQGANNDESGASQVAIDNKIEQAMDLVKSHLMYAVREEVDVLKEQIQELRDKNAVLEYENKFLRAAADPATIEQLKAAQPPPPTASS